MTMDNPFSSFHEAVADRLRADEWLSALPAPRIVTERAGDIGSAIEKELGSCGLCIAVATPEFVRGGEGTPDEILVEVLVDVSERPLANRGASGTKKVPIDVASVVIACLWDARICPGFTPLLFQRSNLVAATPERVTYEIRFQTRLRVAVVADPNPDA